MGSQEQHLQRQAVLYSYPLYEMSRMLAATAPRRDAAGRFAGTRRESTARWMNTFVHTKRLLGPDDRQVVLPNSDTLYSLAWLDLAQGPVVLEFNGYYAPYFVIGVTDFFNNPFASVSSSSIQSNDGRVAFCWAGSKEPVPDGVHRIDCPTRIVWLGVRALSATRADLSLAQAFQSTLRICGVDGREVPTIYDPKLSPRQVASDFTKFRKVVSRALREMVDADGDAIPVDILRSAAIGQPTELTSECQAGLQSVLDSVLEELRRPIVPETTGAWAPQADVARSFGTDFAARAHAAHNCIGVLGKEDATYVVSDSDAEGRRLEGRYEYELVFPADRQPRVGAFWSLTLYEMPLRVLFKNPVQRYSVGSHGEPMRFEQDGALGIIISSAPPDDSAHRSNWLPAPAGAFCLVLRLYEPDRSHLDGTFVYPAIRRRGG